MNQKGENIEENGIKLKAMKEKMKKLGSRYNTWKKSHSFKVGEVGTEENKETVDKAKDMFRERKIHKFRPGRKMENKTGGKMKFENQLKSKEQLIKQKKKSDQIKFKNLPKHSKRKINESKNTNRKFKK